MVKQKTFPSEFSEGQSSLLRGKFTVEGAALSTATQDSFNEQDSCWMSFPHWAEPPAGAPNMDVLVELISISMMSGLT